MLNNRELASLIWFGIGTVILLAVKDIRTKALELVPSALRVLALPVLLLAGWTIVIVALASETPAWRTEFASDTAIWFIGTAPAFMFDLAARPRRDHFFKIAMTRVLKVTGNCSSHSIHQPLRFQSSYRSRASAISHRSIAFLYRLESSKFRTRKEHV